MKIVRNKVLMAALVAALVALLAIKGASAALDAVGTKPLLPPISGLGMGSLLPLLPPLPALPALPNLGMGSLLPKLPALPALPTLPALPALPNININGRCPTYKTLTPFNKVDFVGDWFVYQQSHNLVETGWTCKKVTYSPTTNAFTYSYKHIGMQMSNAGTYTVPTPTIGALSVQLQNVHALGADSMGRVNQFVVAGAPLDYMILRSCTFYPAVPGLLSFNFEYVYVLTRAQVPSAAVTTAIAAAATAAGVGSVLSAVEQTGC